MDSGKLMTPVIHFSENWDGYISGIRENYQSFKNVLNRIEIFTKSNSTLDLIINFTCKI